MERECCLSMLISLIGGTTLLACGWWPVADGRVSSARRLEEINWRRIWQPVLPALAVAAWLCGWALVEPDPVPEKVPVLLLLMSLPFALLFVRAAVRATCSLIGDQGDPATATVGLLRPRIVFSPHLARRLDDQQVEAALQHEWAHARHRDPLRIWLAQFATDLQWPWPQAHQRLRRWLLALELARDEEALAAGVEGSDLAGAILASARFGEQRNLPVNAALAGDTPALKERIRRLLEASPRDAGPTRASSRGPLLTGLTILPVAVVLGVIFGEQVVRALFKI
jgi:BlaR1 peptidase M56